MGYPEQNKRNFTNNQSSESKKNEQRLAKCKNGHQVWKCVAENEQDNMEHTIKNQK
jgi:hypothetical protein